MKNILTSVFLVLAFCLSASAYNTKVYTKQGGAEMVVSSGGVLSLEAGSTLAVDAAAVIDIAASPTFDAVTVTGAVGSASVAASGNVGAATLSASGASTLLGAVYAGAALTKSTLAANGVITSGAGIVATTSISAGTSIAAGSTLAAGTTVTGGTGVYVTAGPLRLYSRTQAQLEALTTETGFYKCSDCTVTSICESTGGVHGVIGVLDPATACD